MIKRTRFRPLFGQIGVFFMNIAMFVMLLAPLNAYATDWVRLEPEEVIARADLVVQGKYRFEAPDEQKGMWHYYPFEIVQYIAGDAPRNWFAATEQFDGGWSRKHQEQGGQFILFLERQNGDYYVPVAGPNGMISVLDGVIINKDETDQLAYTAYLEQLGKTILTEQPTATSHSSSQHHNAKTIIITVVATVFGAAVIITAVVLLGRSQRT